MPPDGDRISLLLARYVRFSRIMRFVVSTSTRNKRAAPCALCPLRGAGFRACAVSTAEAASGAGEGGALSARAEAGGAAGPGGTEEKGQKAAGGCRLEAARGGQITDEEVLKELWKELFSKNISGVEHAVISREVQSFIEDASHTFTEAAYAQIKQYRSGKFDTIILRQLLVQVEDQHQPHARLHLAELRRREAKAEAELVHRRHRLLPVLLRLLLLQRQALLPALVSIDLPRLQLLRLGIESPREELWTAE